MTKIDTNILSKGGHYHEIRLSKEGTDENSLKSHSMIGQTKWYDKTFAIYSQLLYFIFVVVVVICGKVAHTKKILQQSFTSIFIYYNFCNHSTQQKLYLILKT